MATLAEKIASLSPEHREMVEREAGNLIAEERARRAGSLSKRRPSVGKGHRYVLVAKYSYVRKAGVTGVRKRGYRQVLRVSRGRLLGARHRQYLSVPR